MINTKNFLLFAGIGAVLFSLAGFFGIIGPDAAHSIFGEKWWMDNEENYSHLFVGLLSIIAALFFSAVYEKVFMWFMTVLSIGFSIYSITVFHFIKVNLEDPIEEVIYFTMGNLALLAIYLEFKREQDKELRKLQNLSR